MGFTPRPDTGRESVGRALDGIHAVVPLFVGTTSTLAMMLMRPSLSLFGLSSSWIQTERGLVHVFDSGESNTNEPPLILIHGACTTGHSMLLLAMLLKRGRRVIIPDLFDFDFSFSATPLRDGDIEDHIEQISAVVRWVVMHGATEVDLCGHSHGGHITARAAVLAKEFVRRVVLLCPAGLNRNKVFKSMHIWHAPAEWLAPRLFPQLPPMMASLAMKYAAGAKPKKTTNQYPVINYHQLRLIENMLYYDRCIQIPKHV